MLRSLRILNAPIVRDSSSTLSRRVVHFHASRIYASDTAQADARVFLKTFTTDTIPRQSCELSFSRSSGPGGQNVNKLNTKATLRVQRQKMSWIPSFIIEELQANGSQYLTKDGDLVIQSQRNRTQEQNKEDCFQKLASLIVDTANSGIQGETSEDTKKKVGKLIKRENEHRIKSKKMHSSKKSARRSRGGDD